jgi:hypothetical protein
MIAFTILTTAAEVDRHTARGIAAAVETVIADLVMAV